MMAYQIYQYNLAVQIRKISPPVYKYGVEKQQEYLPLKMIMKKSMIIFYYLNHSIKDDGFQKVIIASVATVVFICAIEYYNRWVYRSLKEMWFIS